MLRSPTFVDVHTPTDFPDSLLVSLILMFTLCLICLIRRNSTILYRRVKSFVLYVSLTLYWSSFLSLWLICGHSLVCRLNQDVVAVLSLFLTRLVSVIRYVSICLFFLCVYCWIPCICWRLDCRIHGQYLGEPNYHKYDRCDESCGQTHGVVWSSRRITWCPVVRHTV